MALVELKSNLANYRSEFTTPSVASQTVNNLRQTSKSNINKTSNSNLDIDSIPPSYVLRTQFTNSFIDSSLFDRSNNFISRYAGSTKFTQNTVNTSKYNIDSNPSKFSPQGIYSPSKFNFNAVVNTSKYNIDTTPRKFSPTTKYTPTNLYPESKVPTTTTRWKGTTAPAVNFFIDNKSGATGFTTKFTDPNQTKFIGATNLSYTYPKLLGLSDRLVSRPLTNSKFPNTGTATLADQLPGGSVFQYAKEGVIVSKKFSTKGYSESRKYGDNVKSIKDQSSKSLLFTRATEENSPSAIDQQYKKFNLRDESYNPSYMPQPFVLRGIQRKGKETPQYWGFGSKAGFDDGLIRGGIVTVADRVVSDTVRIAKWMASPKGLLWIVKQIGLGLTNPKVEATGGFLSRQTRIHTGITSLLSVAGSPFGLHFTRHGLPFINDVASYENVQIRKKLLFDLVPGRSNRLLSLKNELGLNKRSGISLIQKGMEIPSLSGLGGPNSVYGIGLTGITRGSKSIETTAEAILDRLLIINPFSIEESYAGDKSGYQTSIATGNAGYKRKGKVPFLSSRYFNGRLRPDLETISKNLFTDILIINGPSTVAKDYSANPYKPYIVDNRNNLDTINPFSELINYAGNKSGYATSISKGNDGYKREGEARPDLEKTSKNLLDAVDFLNGPSTVAKDYSANPYNPYVADAESKDLITRKAYNDKLYAVGLRANTNHDFDATNTNQSTGSVSDLENRSAKLYNDRFNGSNSSTAGYKSNPYAPYIADADAESKGLITRKTYSDKQYAGTLRAKTKHTFDVNRDTNTNTSSTVDVFTSTDPETKDSLRTLTYGITGSNNIETNAKKVEKYPGSPKNPINDYITLAYGKIPTKLSSIIPNDFRNDINKANTKLTDIQKGFVGINANAKYYNDNNLEGKYGFGNLGEVGADRSNPNAFAASGLDFGQGNRRIIVQKNSRFRGDKVNALDVNLNGISSGEIYPEKAEDLIKFYFQDGAVQNGSTGNVAVMAFRATMTGFTDSFSPGWDRIDIMGRPDGAYLYNSFERNISFNFTVAALSRSEMIPMWRKLNYLASYTMPDFNGNQKPSGPFMRITIGDLFHQTPGFITSLSYTIPDDATWDIAEDAGTNDDAKQLPMVVEASVSFTIVGDYRPQMHGRVYSLSKNGTRKSEPGQWLSDAIPK